MGKTNQHINKGSSSPNSRYSRLKWTGLLTFALLYNLVYMARFNVNNSMQYIADELSISPGSETIITTSVFIGYAIGCLVNGYVADIWDGKKVVVLGGIMTVVLNMSVAEVSNIIVFGVLWFINGYFQSMIWVGGISLLAQWWQPAECGKSVGIANFFSGLSHATAYVIPMAIIAIIPDADWRANFEIPMIVLLAFVALFALAAVGKPEDAGLKPYKLSGERRVCEEILWRQKASGRLPIKLFMNRTFFIWCMIALMSSICRYGLLKWVPLYSDRVSDIPVVNSTFLYLMLPIGMAIGTLIITWIASSYFRENFGIVIIALSGMCASLIIVFPMLDNQISMLTGIFFTGFVLYGINGIFWIYAIDFGGRVYAGTATGILNCFAYLGASVEDKIFSSLISVTDNYISIFILMEFICIAMATLGILITRKNTRFVADVGTNE